MDGVPARRPALLLRWAAVLLVEVLFLAVGLASNPLHAQEVVPVDRILIFKSRRLLELLHQQEVVHSYRIDLGHNPVGTKLNRGDNRTPEGIYQIDRRQASRYHLALHISYPNAADIADARSQHRDPGGAIFIHGFPPGYELADPDVFRKDWTAGCIAVSDHAIEEIWRMVPVGTVVEIRP
jgi:murein L,D-transpeptidase YafK